MKFILLTVFCASLVFCTPVERGNSDAEYIGGASFQQPEDRGVEYPVNEEPSRRFPVVIVDTPSFDRDDDEDEDGLFGPGPQFYGPRPGFGSRPTYPMYHSPSDYFRRMREQFLQIQRMNELMRNLFNFGQFGPRPILPPASFPGFFNNDFGNFSDLPTNYDNTTFTTKNINGTIISVNETIRKIGNNDSSFVFHVKTIQVRPENETLDGDDGEVDLVEGQDTFIDNAGSSSSSSRPTSSGDLTTESATESVDESSSSSSGVTSNRTDTSEDPTANDVNLARRFRRNAQ